LIAMGVMPLFGWRPMFFIGALLTLVILVFVLLNQLEDAAAFAARKTAQTGGHPSVKQLFKGRFAVFAALIAAAAIPNMFTWYGLNTWLTAVMGELDFALTDALLFSFTLTGGAIVGSFLTATWADKWGAVKVGAVMASLTAAGLVGMVTGPQSTSFLLVCVALMGAGGHTTMNLINTAATNLFPSALRGTALGWSNGTSYIGAIASPFTGGLFLSSFGPYGVFFLYGASAVTAALVMTYFSTVQHKDDVQESSDSAELVIK
jgi:AAHS family benzoate transporter-like MFS transporter